MSQNRFKAKYNTVYAYGKQMRAHRHVAEMALGRELRADEHVHHINGDSRDDRPANLRILSPQAHMQHHLVKPEQPRLLRRRVTREEALVKQRDRQRRYRARLAAHIVPPGCNIQSGLAF